MVIVAVIAHYVVTIDGTAKTERQSERRGAWKRDRDRSLWRYDVCSPRLGLKQEKHTTVENDLQSFVATPIKDSAAGHLQAMHCAEEICAEMN